jgi:hypothetical protein
MNVASWSNYKTLVSNKLLLIQYSETNTHYEIFAPEGNAFLWAFTLLKGTSDATDFENNYKASANQKLGSDGMPMVAPNFQETQMFTNEAIRDTSNHNSVSANNYGYRVKTIIIDNQLNQTVSMQCQASRDGTNWFNLGNPFTVSENTLTYESCDAYFPYMRGVASCSVAPISGNLNAWMDKMGV